MVRWEAMGTRVTRDLWHAERLAFFNDHAEQAMSARRLAQLGALLGRNAQGDELLDVLPIVFKYAKRAVARLHQPAPKRPHMRSAIECKIICQLIELAPLFTRHLSLFQGDSALR